MAGRRPDGWLRVRGDRLLAADAQGLIVEGPRARRQPKQRSDVQEQQPPSRTAPADAKAAAAAAEREQRDQLAERQLTGFDKFDLDVRVRLGH